MVSPALYDVATEGDRSASFEAMAAGPHKRRPAPLVRPSTQQAVRRGSSRSRSASAASNAGRGRRPNHSNGHLKRHRSPLRYLLAIPALAVVLIGFSLVAAALSPGNASLEAKWADWLRANHAGWLAQHFEEIYYSLEAPPKGGKPKGLNKVPGTVAVNLPASSPTTASKLAAPASTATAVPTSRPGAGAGTNPAQTNLAQTNRSAAAQGSSPQSRGPLAKNVPTSALTLPPSHKAASPQAGSPTAGSTTAGSTTAGSTTATSTGPTGAKPLSSKAVAPRAVQPLPPPKPVPLVVHPALAGEGQWQPTGPLVDGSPAMYVAQFRADDIYTSEITSAVWMDPRLLRFELVPGSTEPGGTWSHPPYVTDAELPYLVAAFNGGFRFQDAKGGIYLEGKVGVPLLQGAASFVIYKNGTVNIGAWGSQVTMTPEVASVLQNAVLLVNNGQIAPSATYTDNAIWGYTLGGGYVVPRSGVGVTADGALVYVAGPALTARSLAESLQRAGAVRAMTLDINPEWVTFNFYSHPPGRPLDVTGTKLYPQMQRSADRYLPPVWEERDFFEVLLPGAPISG